MIHVIPKAALFVVWNLMAGSEDIAEHGRDWFNAGADGQIDWGTHGDFEQCVAIAGKYMADPEGY